MVVMVSFLYDPDDLREKNATEDMQKKGMELVGSESTVNAVDVCRLLDNLENNCCVDKYKPEALHTLQTSISDLEITDGIGEYGRYNKEGLAVIYQKARALMAIFERNTWDTEDSKDLIACRAFCDGIAQLYYGLQCAADISYNMAATISERPTQAIEGRGVVCQITRREYDAIDIGAKLVRLDGRMMVKMGDSAMDKTDQNIINNAREDNYLPFGILETKDRVCLWIIKTRIRATPYIGSLLRKRNKHG